MRAALVVGLLLAGACGGSGTPGGSTLPPPPDGAYSCQASFPGADGGAGMPAVCVEVVGGTAQDVANNRQKCEMEGNTFSLVPCPREGALGGCRETTPTALLTTWYYADGTSTPSDIEMLCDQLGVLGLPIQFVTP